MITREYKGKITIPTTEVIDKGECQEVAQRREVGWEPLLGPSFIECLIAIGHEDSEDGYNIPLNLSKV